MDHWSKYHVIWPLKRKTARKVAKRLNDLVFPYLGLPQIFQSDNGREFVNVVVHALIKSWGGDDVHFINRHPRHSQSQGLVEAGNNAINCQISKRRAQLRYTNSPAFPWPTWLPKIHFTLNTTVSSATKKTPYELAFGQKKRTNVMPGASSEGNLAYEELFLEEDALEPTPEEEPLFIEKDRAS